MKRCISLFVIFVLSVASAQTTVTPTTEVENFIGQSGVITLRETLGKTYFRAAKYGGGVEIEAVRVSQPDNKKSVLGVRFNVADTRSSRSIFIDVAELQGLIGALSYISSNSKALDQKLNPELTFTSKAGLRIGFLNSPDLGPSGFVSAGLYTAFFTPENIAEMHDTLVTFQPLLK